MVQYSHVHSIVIEKDQAWIITGLLSQNTVLKKKSNHIKKTGGGGREREGEGRKEV